MTLTTAVRKEMRHTYNEMHIDQHLVFFAHRFRPPRMNHACQNYRVHPKFGYTQAPRESIPFLHTTMPEDSGALRSSVLCIFFAAFVIKRDVMTSNE